MIINRTTYRRGFESLLTQIQQSEQQYDVIFGITRGGMILATQLAYALDVNLNAITISHRDNAADGIDLHAFHRATERGKKILVVDDIVDSGKTFGTLTDLYGDRFDGCVLVENTAQSYRPRFSAFMIDRNSYKDWVTFWWDPTSKPKQIEQ